MDFSDEKADGKVDIVQDENGSITFVHQHDDYNYRPTSLYFLNYLEFFCLFQRVSKEKDKKEKKNRRKCNLVLNFQDKHPMSETKCLKLRSLHFTPILAGQPRPPWSSFKDKKAKKNFILYYATLFIPWGYKFEDADLPADLKEFGPAESFLKVDKFCNIMQIWSGKHGKVPALVRARYYTFYNIVHNMNSPHKGRMASIKWRVRGADKWCDMKQQDLPPIYENNKERNTNLERYDPETIRAADAAIEQLQQYGEASENNASDYLHHRQNYMNELQNTFKDAYSTPAGMSIESDIETTANTELICPIHKIPFETWETFDNGWALNKLDQMKNIKIIRIVTKKLMMKKKITVH